jgi:hypothetical protein
MNVNEEVTWEICRLFGRVGKIFFSGDVAGLILASHFNLDVIEY